MKLSNLCIVTVVTVVPVTHFSFLFSTVNYCPFGLPLAPGSLAVHPDKITIATGQVAGTSSDGKVREYIPSQTLSCLEGYPHIKSATELIYLCLKCICARATRHV